MRMILKVLLFLTILLLFLISADFNKSSSINIDGLYLGMNKAEFIKVIKNKWDGTIGKLKWDDKKQKDFDNNQYFDYTFLFETRATTGQRDLNSLSCTFENMKLINLHFDDFTIRRLFRLTEFSDNSQLVNKLEDIYRIKFIKDGKGTSAKYFFKNNKENWIIRIDSFGQLTFKMIK